MHTQTRTAQHNTFNDRESHAAVLGGSGFVGSHLVDALLTHGYRVSVIDDLSTGSPDNLTHIASHPRLSVRTADVTQDPLVIDGRLDVVFNLASPASPLDYARMPVSTLLAGSHGTLAALRLAAEHRARFVLASTSEVYGDPEVHPQTEDYWGHVNPVGPRSQYDEAKRFAEALTVAHDDVDWAIARIFNTYGPRMRTADGRVVPTFIDQALHGVPITITGDGSQTRSLCHVEDTVRGLLALADCGQRCVVNIGNPHETSVDEIASLIRELAGSTSPLTHIPLPTDDPRRRRPDITRALDILGWRPVIDLRDGLVSTLNWYAAQLGIDTATEYVA